MGIIAPLLFLLLFVSNASANGFIIDTTKIYGPSAGWQGKSAVAFDGMNYMVVWEDVSRDGYSQIRGCRIAPSGEVLDKGGFSISYMEECCATPVIAFDGTNYLIAWRGQNLDSGFGYNVISCARINPSGILLDSFPIQISLYGAIKSPAVATCGSNFLIAFRYAILPSYQIYFARISSQGALLDSTPILASEGSWACFSPSVSFDDSNYLLVWQNSDNFGWDSCYQYLEGVRIDTSGTLLDTLPAKLITLKNPSLYPTTIFLHTNPHLAFGRQHHLLTWNYIDLSGDNSQNIFAARINPSGTVLDTNLIDVNKAVGNQVNPSVAFDGNRFIVIWEDYRDATDDFLPRLFFTTIDTIGNVTDTLGISLLQDTIHLLQEPAICAGMNEWFVSFTDRRGNPFKYDTDKDIFGCRISDAGNPLDTTGLLLSFSTQHQRKPAAAFDGQNHLVVWEDERGDDTDIYGAIVDSLGNLLYQGVFAINENRYEQISPGVDFIDPYYFVFWLDFRITTGISELYGARVKKDGTVLDPNGIAFNISDTAHGRIPTFSLANDDSNFLVLWNYYEPGFNATVRAFRIDTAANVLDPGGIYVDSFAYAPCCAYDGNNWLLSYIKYYHGRVVGLRLSRDGMLIPPRFEISDFTPWFSADPLSIAFNGANYLITWSRIMATIPDNIDIFASRASPDGYDLDTNDIVVSNLETVECTPNVSRCQDGFLTAWTDIRDEPNPHMSCIKTIYRAFIDSDGIVNDTNGIPCTPPNTESKTPALSQSLNNGNLLCYSRFTDSPFGSYRIYVQLLDPPAGISQTMDDKLPIFTIKSLNPNPFSSSIQIKYHLSQEAIIDLSIFDLSGRLLRKLDSGMKSPGYHVSQWNGFGKNNAAVPSGIYFCRFSNNYCSQTRKIILIR